MAEWVWVLEKLDRESGRYCGNYKLSGLSDEDARSLAGLKDLGTADLFDVSEASLGEISFRFGLNLFPEKFEYLLGRVAPPLPDAGEQAVYALMSAAVYGQAFRSARA